MRYASSHTRSPSRNNKSLLNWTLLWGSLLIVIFIIQYFIGGSQISENTLGWLSVSWSWKIVITNINGKKRDIVAEDTFSSSDSLISILSGNAHITGNSLDVWADKWAEISYETTNWSGWSLGIIQWRSWIEGGKDSLIKLKHIDLVPKEGSIILVEQQRIYSIAYVLKWSIEVRAGGSRDYILEAGKWIKVSQSDLISPGTSLASLSDTIDDSIKQNPFFISRNGQEILNQNVIKNQTWTTISSSGTNQLISQINGIWGKSITITSPIDGAIVSGNSLKVEWKIINPLVLRIMINDREALINKQTQSFSLGGIPIISDTLDIVYKAYNEWGNLIERGVLTLYSEVKKQGTDRLIPTTFPTSDKTFRILSPSENPYKTNINSVTVSWSVPKSTVEYITVNNFRLKKFAPNSSTWYYYANTSYGTMKEGFNLYEIKFFATNDTLLSTQLFTIIKEWGTSTLSWE